MTNTSPGPRARPTPRRSFTLPQNLDHLAASEDADPPNGGGAYASALANFSLRSNSLRDPVILTLSEGSLPMKPNLHPGTLTPGPAE